MIRAKNSAGLKRFVQQFDDPNDRWPGGHPNGAAGKPAWNRGKSPSTETRAKQSKALTGRKGTPHTAESKAKLSEKAKANGSGGYIPGSGRGKRGWYRDFWCDSSWELAFVMYHLDHGIDISRNDQRFSYVYKGQEHHYTPDFVVSGELVEVKGVVTEQWQAKVDQFPGTLKVLYKEDMQPFIGYAQERYGRDFTRLYEER